ncbi:MAG: amidohydrolase family protein [Planctomycetota bacterium]|nr:amidohydrolase family protein [Planctomycetota bacterium]
MRVSPLWSGILCLLMLQPTVLFAEGEGFVLRAATVHTGLRVIDDGAIVVRDGKVVQAGRWEDLAEQFSISDLPLIHWPDAYVTPGWVAASSQLVAPHPAPESIHADFRAVDGYNRYGDHRPLLESGVTTAHLSPGEHRLVSGQGAVVKLVGAPDQRILRASADLSLSLTDAVDGASPLLEIPFPASSDVAITAPSPQRPRSRIGRLLALSEALAKSSEDPLIHGGLGAAWSSGMPVRVAASKASEILAAISFLRAKERAGYIVGGAEIALVAPAVAAAGIPLVLRIQPVGGDVGFTDREPVEGLSSWPQLGPDGLLALAPPEDDLRQLRWALVEAATHMERPDDAVALVTHHPALILGVADRVGRLEAGADADLVIWNEGPWKVTAHPLQVIADGAVAWKPQTASATVIRAETIWLSPEQQIDDGEVLIEQGKIVAVGRRVPHPPHSRVVDAGSGSFLVPGFIDSYGHLGLRQDAGSSGTGDRLYRLIGAADEPEHRVARSGVTSQLLTPMRLQRGAATAVVVKTAGRTRSERAQQPISALLLEASGHPDDALGSIARLMSQGKKYLDSWTKYQESLAEWEKKKAAGEKIELKEEIEEEVVEEQGPDPLTGIWELTISGGPIPEPEVAEISIQLDGEKFEGRIVEPAPPIPVRVVGTLNGTTIHATIEVEDGVLPAEPKIVAELTDEDSLTGTISLLQFTAEVVGTRTSKKAKSFKVERRKKRDEDGRPNPPRINLALEPVRMVLEMQIPVVVTPSGLEVAAKVIEFFSEKKIPLTLRLGQEMRQYRDLLAEKSVSVILPPESSFTSNRQSFAPGNFLSRSGINVAFQSQASDGARALQQQALQAVERGMSADAALHALSGGAAKALGVADRIGSIKIGLDADLLIWDGHPLEAGSRLHRVFIHGEEVPR